MGRWARAARRRRDARRSVGAYGVGGVVAATRHLQYAIARHLRKRPLLASFPLFSSEQQPLQADQEGQEHGRAWAR